MASNVQQDVPTNSLLRLAICPHPNPLRSLNLGPFPGISSFDQISRVVIPCGVIKRMPLRDQEIAIRFVEKLVMRQAWLRNKKEVLQAKKRKIDKQICQMSHELEILEASPYAWIALESEFFDYEIPQCVRIMIKQMESKLNLFCEDT